MIKQSYQGNHERKFASDFLGKLNEMVSFPTRIKFSLYKDSRENKQTIMISEMGRSLKNKKIENIRFKESQSLLLEGHVVTLNIGDYENGNEVLKEVLRLSRIWEGTLVKFGDEKC